MRDFRVSPRGIIFFYLFLVLLGLAIKADVFPGVDLAAVFDKGIAAPASATSAAPRRLDRGDVYLLHTHHRIKCALCFITASR